MSFFFEVVPSTGALGLVSLEEVPPCGRYGAIGVSRTWRTRIIDAGNFSRLYCIGFGVSSHSQSPKSKILATQLTHILGTFHPKGVHRVTNPSTRRPIRREIPAKTRHLPLHLSKPRAPSQQADNTPGTALTRGAGTLRYPPLQQLDQVRTPEALAHLLQRCVTQQQTLLFRAEANLCHGLIAATLNGEHAALAELGVAHGIADR